MGILMQTNKDLSYQEPLLEALRAFSLETDYKKVLQSIISLGAKLTKSEVASILKYEEADEYLYFLAVPHTQRDSMRSLRVPLEASIAGWVYQYAETLIIQDVKEDKRFYSEIDEKVAFQTHSVLAVPLLVKGKPVGVLEAINKTSHAHYNGEDVIILETLASQAALIIENMNVKQRTMQIQAAADRLEQMKKNFIAIASHELRTPLGLVLGHATFLREVVEEKHHDQLDVIIRSGGKLKDIIENLSNVENFESGAARIRMRQFSLSDLVRNTTNSFQKKAHEKNITLYTEINAPNLLIEGDAEKVGIAIDNLLKNALTFTPEKGRIAVSLEQITGYAKLSIIDNGIGIPSEELSRIFERFYQIESHLTRRYGGMGLGLSVTKVMIELHGGRVWAESILGKGSKFSFLLPLDRNQVNAAQRVFQR